MEYKDFTSLPPEQEQSFVIYERTTAESSKKAKTFGMIAGAVIGVFAIILFLSFDAPKNAHAVEPETDLKAEVPKAKPAPAPVEAAPAPAAETAPTEAAPAATVEAPKPPKGATKAPPTALIKK